MRDAQAPRRVTFEVNQGQLFDTLRQMNGDTEPLGTRLVSTLLAGPSFAEQVGMAVYGVTVVDEGHG